jgi:histidyl-tRNA synthetase
MSKPEWEAYGRAEGFAQDQINGFLRIIEDKDYFKSSAELMRFFDALKAYGASDFVEFDGRVVRGLDYYTGIVFEARDIGENTRAILGGGRYDNLVGDVGGDPLPGIGFAMGDVVLSIILRELNRLPELELQPAKILVTVFDSDSFDDSITLAAILREAGYNTLVYPETAKLGKQFKFADRLGLDFALVLGPDEIAHDQVQAKNLKTGEQTSVPNSELFTFLQKHLSS